jgi:hypothetical protein
MERLPRKIVINGAPSQYDRRQRALAPGYAPVDGRSFTELMAFAGRFGSLVRFYDLEDRPDGDWSGFFLADPALVLAAVQALDPAAVESGFAALERRIRGAAGFEAKLALLREAFEEVLGLARQVDGWLRATQQAGGGALLQLRELLLAAVDAELRPALRRLKAYDEGAGLGRALEQPIGLDYAGLLPLWELGAVRPDGAIYRGGSRGARVDAALPHLASLLFAFLDGLRGLAPFAAAALPQALEGGAGKPHLALYTAFARLFAHAQRQVNGLSDRYAGFYYRDVLRGRERGARSSWPGRTPRARTSSTRPTAACASPRRGWRSSAWSGSGAARSLSRRPPRVPRPPPAGRRRPTRCARCCRPRCR